MTLTSDQRRIAREAIAHADEVDCRIVEAYPQPWERMDQMRASNGQEVSWPDWCLLPVGAAAVIASTSPGAVCRG